MMTVGHSTRPIGEFTRLLQAHGVETLVDIRTIPRSRHNPQFNSDALPDSLARAGIRYVHMPALGGLRHARADSINTGWRNAGFRGYADYMQTPAFAAALDELISLGRAGPAAIMCAESVPWRCHRFLIADALAARGIPVEHIMTETSRKPHSITPFARIEGARVTYPAAQPGLGLA
jgi:uncharacterized protein (DUF488 family)